MVHNDNKTTNHVKPIEKPVEKPHKEENKVIKIMYVTADTLNVREGAGTDFDRIGQLNKGTKVEVVKVGEYWDKIKFDGKYGYVFNKYLSDSKPVEKPEKVLGIAYVNSKTLDVKAKESEDSKTLGTLKYGDKVELLG